MEKTPSKRMLRISGRPPKVPPKKKQDGAPNMPEANLPDVKLTETDGWLTRDETSDVLRCSLQTIKNYEAQGKLHPRYAMRKDRGETERMMLVYNPKELAELPAKKPGGPREALREPGEQAARVFERLREGVPLDEIVIELRETPDRIDQLNERWLEQTKERHVITPTARKALEELVGSFKDVTELVELIKKKLAPASTPEAAG